MLSSPGDIGTFTYWDKTADGNDRANFRWDRTGKETPMPISLVFTKVKLTQKALLQMLDHLLQFPIRS